MTEVLKGWTRHASPIEEMGHDYKILVRKRENMRGLNNPRRIRRRTGFIMEDTGRKPVTGPCRYHNDASVYNEGGKLIDQLNNSIGFSWTLFK